MVVTGAETDLLYGRGGPRDECLRLDEVFANENGWWVGDWMVWLEDAEPECEESPSLSTDIGDDDLDIQSAPISCRW